jgi:ADP-ribose pyrophosphatase
MPDAGPWKKRTNQVVYATPRLSVYRDEVVRPDGKADQYDWVEVPDQVRVAALVGNGLLVIDQHHYLSGRMLQLPGGSIDPNEDDHQAARRELLQETGYRGGVWSSHGHLFPLPGVSPVKVHLWSARGLIAGPPKRDSAEADLRVVRLSLAEAVQAVRGGGMKCAASAFLILIMVGVGGGQPELDDRRWENR